ncbi:MAG: UDP-N-acetylmuramate dehydrogenase [Fretibacterium sp.]|nr:UDP-N-acetylmuramate dehydrogenase [Fretibacterium sp.]
MLADELERNLICRVGREVPLAPLSTLGVGGIAEYFLEPSCADDFQTLFSMRAEKGFPLYILGGGSNTVFADGLIPGVFLSTREWKDSFWSEPEAGTVTVECQTGHPLASLVNEAVRRGLGGLEFSVGIPGTVGGAIAGNAGAGGQSVGALLKELETVEPDGALKRWERGEFSCAYRSFPLAKERHRLFLSCKIVLHCASEESIEAELERFRSARSIQPRGERSAGCSFRNPDGAGKSAGQLLDQCGCKGMTAGDAVVSDRHANFILNRGHAGGADVVSLIKACQERVFARTGIRLVPEVRFLGFEQEVSVGTVGEKRGPCES